MYAKIFVAFWLGLQGFLYIATAQAESPPTADAGKDLIHAVGAILAKGRSLFRRIDNRLTGYVSHYHRGNYTP